MKKILLILFIVTTPFYSQFIPINAIGDTTFFSSTITDSASGWSSFTTTVGGTYEVYNTGADTITYKLQSGTPAVTQVGLDITPLSSIGRFYLEAGSKIWFRERANALYSKLHILWYQN